MRARNIKPGFFCNEELVELSPLCRLFFIGLWCFADREGRFEARPTKIKMSIFPAESHDVQAMLDDLTRTGFLHFYEVNGSKFYEINNFARHQKPHIREQESMIPPRNEQSTTLAVPEHNLGDAEPALNEDCGMRIVECGKRNDAQPRKTRPQADASPPYRWIEFVELYPENGTIFDTAGKNWWRKNVRKGDDALVDTILAGVKRWNGCKQYREGMVFNCGKWLANRAFEKPTPDEVANTNANKTIDDFFKGCEN